MSQETGIFIGKTPTGKTIVSSDASDEEWLRLDGMRPLDKEECR